MMELTPKLDTYILYIFTMVAGYFLFFGIAHTNDFELLNELDDIFSLTFGVVFIIFLVLIPLYFRIWGVKKIRRSITNDLKKLGKRSFNDICPRCKKVIVPLKKWVIDWNDLRYEVTCNNCTEGKPLEIKFPGHIG